MTAMARPRAESMYRQPSNARLLCTYEVCCAQACAMLLCLQLWTRTRSFTNIDLYVDRCEGETIDRCTNKGNNSSLPLLDPADCLRRAYLLDNHQRGATTPFYMRVPSDCCGTLAQVVLQ